MLPNRTGYRTPLTGAASKFTTGVESLRLGGHVSAAEVERCLAHSEPTLSQAHAAYIDLSDAVHFDVVGLQRLLSVVSSRQNAGKFTRFRLPNDSLARHILRLWRFPLAVSTITLTPFRLLVDTDDWEYFGERWPEMRVGLDSTLPRASVLAYLVERQYFGLSSHNAQGHRGLDRVVELEVAHWGGYALSNLLSKVLRGPAADVARVIAQEALMNVLQRSREAVVVVGSQLDLVQHNEIGAPAGLTFSVWDDGPSIISTFRAQLASACTAQPPTLDLTQQFTIETGGWAPESSFYMAWAPDLNSPDPEILLASVVYGISRKLRSASEVVSHIRGLSQEEGMMTLCRTAVDTFHGSVEIRSEQSIIVIDRPDSSALYRARLALDRSIGPVTGDIVTVRLPVHND